MALKLARFSSTLNDQYRQVMRSVGSSVSIITCMASNGEEAGMTISSLSSVSLNPKPIISFNIQIPSRTSRILDDCGGRFAVNILPATPTMKELALAFAGRNGHEFNPFKEFPDNFKFHNNSDINLPTIKDAHVLICEIHKTVTIQDHLAVFAQIQSTMCGNANSMVYINSQFHTLGDEI